MMFNSFIILLAISNFALGLPMIRREQLSGVASLGDLSGALDGLQGGGGSSDLSGLLGGLGDAGGGSSVGNDQDTSDVSSALANSATADLPLETSTVNGTDTSTVSLS